MTSPTDAELPAPSPHEAAEAGRSDGPAGPRVPWTRADVGVVAVLVLCCELVALQYSLVIPGLGQMAGSFATTQVAWLVTAFGVAGGVATPALGRLGDLHGKRRVLLVVLGTSAMGSVVVATAGSFPVAVGGRVLQGAGLAIVPLAYSLLRDLLPPRLLPVALSVSTTGFGLVTVAGPFLAGWLVDDHGFRTVFWLLAVLPLVLLAAVLLAVPEPGDRAVVPVDWLGAALLAVGTAAILVGLNQSVPWGWASSSVLFLLAGGAAALVVWWALQRQAPGSLVPPGLFAGPVGRAVVLSTTPPQGAIAVVGTLLPLLVMTPRALGGSYGFGDTALGVSRYTVLAGVLTVAAGFAFGVALPRVGVRALAQAGALVLGVGCAALAVAHGQRWQVVAAYAVVGVGGGLCFAAVPNLVVAVVASADQGVGAGTLAMVHTLGASIGVQAAFAALGGPTAVTEVGQPVYEAGGYRAALLLAAGLAVFGALAAAGLPRRSPAADAVDAPGR